MHMEKWNYFGFKKVFTLKKKVKVVKYSTRSESHQPSSMDYSEVCIAHEQMKMKKYSDSYLNVVSTRLAVLYNFDWLIVLASLIPT